MRWVIVSVFLMIVGCKGSTENTPISFTDLPDNEIILMDIRACHSGCTQGRIKYQHGRAYTGERALVLTPKEKEELDQYLTLGQELDSDWMCSISIMITLKRKRGLKTVSKHEQKIFPCHFQFEAPSVMNAYGLAMYLLDGYETPDGEPYWRDPEFRLELKLTD